MSERKAEVTFRPNDSIIPTEEVNFILLSIISFLPAVDVKPVLFVSNAFQVKEEESVNGVKVESAAAQEVVQGINFAFPLGECSL